MNIAVLGASGQFGATVSDVLGHRGHRVIPVSRSHGVDVLEGSGLADALTDVDVVLDCLHINTMSGRRSIDFFTHAARNVVGSARAQGVGRIVCLSIAGATNPRVNQGFGYYRGKAAQESLYQEADIPTTTVRSTQWFEFVPGITAQTTKGPVTVLPSMLMAPAALTEVAAFVADVVGEPSDARNDIRTVRGPEVDTVANFARRILRARGDINGLQPKVLREAPYLGRGIATGGLIPADGHVTEQTFREWL